ncbi:hypothetical protein IMSHALPRED_005976 [Imshaugia aleurites]|uniref:Carrier domain-containing protein n=1 Tax=Imshaugia aleurites TaxID=172621 RepID=A0A8H3FMC5_9LECA|nr:hypothetical protein IMSHALPRED_005976 [Imshaugia aleurites]
MPDLGEILAKVPVPLYPFSKSFVEVQYHPFVALHTSGSTGLPKLIVPSHGTMAASDTYQLMPSLGHFPTMVEALRGKRVFVGLPPFHAAGLFMLLAMTTYFDVIPVLGPLMPLTAEIVDQVHIYGDVKVTTLAPTIIEDIVNTPEYCENLKRLDYVMYGGGPLSKVAGDLVSQKTAVISLMGSSETMLLPTVISGKEDWQYYAFSPCMGAEFRHHWEDLYEMVIVRKQEFALSQAVFYTLPELQEYSMKDVYSKHPSRPGLWLYRGRSDDVIVFSTGEKVNPLTMEGIIGIHPDVSSALVVGQGRFQSALLVEAKRPPVTLDEQESLLENIWPAIERANEDCPAHGKIVKHFVLFTGPEKPMLRAGKGTVQRMSTVERYKEELDALYAQQSGLKRPTENLLRLHREESLIRTLQPIVEEVVDVGHFLKEEDLFALGLDSLRVTNLVRYINDALRRVGRNDLQILPRTIYSNPTVDQLAHTVMGMTHLAPGVSEEAVDSEEGMKALLEHYTKDLPLTARTSLPLPSDGLNTVILTGSTGTIGSHLLANILTNPAVAHVYCFTRIRPTPPLERQCSSHETNGLPAHFPPERVSFLETDLSQPYFGLSRPTYKKLLNSVTHILHNAWEVNFNLSIQSFQYPHVHGVRQFINFSSESKYGAFVFFISTISTAMNYPDSHTGPIPESIIDEFSLPQAMGYAESKYVAERMLDEAARVSGVSSAVCRVGQVAGPTQGKGIWRTGEWFPSLIKSSVHLNCLPEDLGPMERVDWVPIDVLAGCIGELVFGPNQEEDSLHPNGTEKATTSTITADKETASKELAPPKENGDMKHLSNSHTAHPNNSTINTTPETTTTTSDETANAPTASAKVYHLVNPSPTTYASLLPSILSALPSTLQPHLVPFEEWVRTLASSDPNPEPNPAIKLVDFFQGLAEMQKAGRKMVVLDTERTRERSESLRGLGKVRREWMAGWMGGWGF